MRPSLDGVRITWLGHATFRLDIEDKVFVIDPWVMNNPKTPADKKMAAARWFFMLAKGLITNPLANVKTN